MAKNKRAQLWLRWGLLTEPEITGWSGLTAKYRVCLNSRWQNASVDSLLSLINDDIRLYTLIGFSTIEDQFGQRSSHKVLS
jgi:hypothetical protein